MGARSYRCATVVALIAAIGAGAAPAAAQPYPSRPTLVETFNVPVFVKRVDMRWIGRNVPIADAKWMGQLLGRLSPDQIRDAFRAAGYSSQDAGEFAAVVQGRIAELNAL